MKKLSIILLVWLTLTGCVQESTEEAVKEEVQGQFTTHNDKLSITTDTETGCKYIILYDWSTNGGMGSGITPLIKADGKTQDCG